MVLGDGVFCGVVALLTAIWIGSRLATRRFEGLIDDYLGPAILALVMLRLLLPLIIPHI